jgi:serine protease Do
MAKQNLYGLLGVSQDAGNSDLEAAYRDACAVLVAQRDAHEPDVQNRLKFLKFALDTLHHPVRRAAYDASLNAPAAATPTAAARPGRDSRPRPFALALTGAALLAALSLAAWKLWPRPAAPLPRVAVARSAPPVAAQADSAPAAAVSERLTPELLFQRNSQSVVVVGGLNGSSTEILQGSGVVIDDERVITNCHVAKSAATTVIKLAGKRYPATLLRFDDNPAHDLCLLEVAGLHAPAIPLAAVESIQVGQKVYALGAPRGLDLTLSEGIVSSLRKQDDSHFIQTTASISPGSSGGGLFNDSGALIGITTFQSVEGQNLNFAVPVDWVAQLMAKTESLPILGAEALDSLRGKWQCPSSKGKERVLLYTFGGNGSFRVARQGDKGEWFDGTYAIMGNHTLVLSGRNTSPPEFYVQVLALSKSELRVSSPFYQDAQTYNCFRLSH